MARVSIRSIAESGFMFGTVVGVLAVAVPECREAIVAVSELRRIRTDGLTAELCVSGTLDDAGIGPAAVRRLAREEPERYRELLSRCGAAAASAETASLCCSMVLLDSELAAATDAARTEVGTQGGNDTP